VGKIIKPLSPKLPLARTLHYLLAPPPGYVVVTWGGVEYYRHRHVYYRRVLREGQSVYVQVSPPVGLTVTNLPPEPDRIVINGQVYYRHGAMFYTQTPAPSPTAAVTGTPAAVQPQYVVAKPPIGALVEELPSGASIVTSDGTTHFRADGVYYLPIHMSGKTRYVVVAPPKGTDPSS